MKKLILLITALLVIFSCSEDNKHTQNDAIIGIWQMTYVIVDSQVFKDYTDGSIPCVGNSTWEFTNTFDMNTISYSGESNASCVILEETVQWSKNGNKYQINLTPKEIIFPDNNTMLWIAEYDTNEDTYWQFQRIN